MPTAPVFQSRDGNDPLSPERFRNLNLTAEQAIQAYDILMRIERQPFDDPDYRQIERTLRESKVQCMHDGRHMLARQKALKEILELTKKLDMSDRKNIEAYSKAETDLDDMEIMLEAATSLYYRLDERIRT